MENVGKAKVIFAIVLGTLSSWLGILFIPVLMMVLSNITDYSTGLLASVSRGEEISSYRSIKGIIKKIGMWVLVLVGWMIDMCIDYSINTLGMQFDIPALTGFTWPCAVACVVALWIVINEIISIKENVKAMGTDVPAFVDKITDGMLSTVEKAIIDDSKKAAEHNERMDDDLK